MKNGWIDFRSLVFGAGLTALAVFGVSAGEGAMTEHYPELARLYRAHGVVQAELFAAMAGINAEPDAAAERARIRSQIDTLNNGNRHDHMAMGHGNHGMTMGLSGPYADLEIQARVQLAGLLRRDYSEEAAASLLENTGALPAQARRVLAAGREFERSLFDIYADQSTSTEQKRAAVAIAVEVYQTENPLHAVAALPKQAELFLAHTHANAAKTAFPALSTLLWTNQWLQLASLEAMVVGQLDPQFQGKVPVTLERYWNKVGSDTGMTMYPVPLEMPSVPAIAPSLYSEVPQAGVILDNLHMLEAIMADIIAYPELDDRHDLLQQAVAEFTSSAGNLADEMEYLLSALRGGIFNQGGPAIGDLTGSERNRSRSAMGMQHSMIMSAPQ